MTHFGRGCCGLAAHWGQRGAPLESQWTDAGWQTVHQSSITHGCRGVHFQGNHVGLGKCPWPCALRLEGEMSPCWYPVPCWYPNLRPWTFTYGLWISPKQLALHVTCIKRMLLCQEMLVILYMTIFGHIHSFAAGLSKWAHQSSYWFKYNN